MEEPLKRSTRIGNSGFVGRVGTLSFAIEVTQRERVGWEIDDRRRLHRVGNLVLQLRRYNLQYS